MNEYHLKNCNLIDVFSGAFAKVRCIFISLHFSKKSTAINLKGKRFIHHFRLVI